MVLPAAAALLPISGAVLGGIEGYRRSGGDLGATLLGSGIGAATPAGFRMAGTALGGTSLAAPLLGTLTKGKGAIRALAGLQGPVTAVTPAALGTLAAGTGLALGAPAIAAGLATQTAKGIIPTAAGAVGTGRMVQGVFDSATGEFTPLETEAAPGMPRGPRTASEMLNPQGYEMGALELQRRAQDVGLEGAGKFMNLERSYLDEAKTRDLARSAAAARLATDLATQQGLTLGGQRIAGAMSQQALGDVGAGLRTQYRYL
jgi:hypothetical protein